jgi:hypothetical protein
VRQFVHRSLLRSFVLGKIERSGSGHWFVPLALDPLNVRMECDVPVTLPALSPAFVFYA